MFPPSTQIGMRPDTLSRGDGAIAVDMNRHLGQGAGRWSMENATALGGIKNGSMRGTDKRVRLRIIGHQHTAVCTPLLVRDKRPTRQMDEETLRVLGFTWLIKRLSRVESLIRVSNGRASRRRSPSPAGMQQRCYLDAAHTYHPDGEAS